MQRMAYPNRANLLKTEKIGPVRPAAAIGTPNGIADRRPEDQERISTREDYQRAPYLSSGRPTLLEDDGLGADEP